VFLYNTGARVGEAAELRVGHLDLGEHARVRLHGKGDKWRTCPLWQQTAALLSSLLRSFGEPPTPETAVFSAHGQPLTRFGMYKIVRRHASSFDDARTNRRVSPHIFRHTAAVNLLEAGVEVNVIRGWLGHADLTTTNRYAEINTRAKEAALRALERLLDMVRAVNRAIRRRPAERAPVAVRRRDLERREQDRLEDVVKQLDTADGGRAERVAVIRVVQTQVHGLRRRILAPRQEAVLKRDLQRRLHGCCPVVGE